MIRRPPRSTRTDTLFPYTTLFRSGERLLEGVIDHGVAAELNHDDLPAVPLKPGQGFDQGARVGGNLLLLQRWSALRSEEHTSELQSLMRISYAVFCLKKTKFRTANVIKALRTHITLSQLLII